MQPHNDIIERSGSEQPAARHARYAEVRSPRPENAFGFSTRFGTRPVIASVCEISSSCISLWRRRGGCTTIRRTSRDWSPPGLGRRHSAPTRQTSGNVSAWRQDLQARPRTRIGRIFADGRKVDAALRSAVREAIRAHHKVNAPTVVWRDGRAVLVPPRKLTRTTHTRTSKTAS